MFLLREGPYILDIKNLNFNSMLLINSSHIYCSEDLPLLELEAVHFSHA